MEDKTLQRLELKSETLKEIAEKTKGDADEMRETLKRLDGFAYGHKELSSKFRDHVKKQQEELSKLVSEGKVAPAIANFTVSYVLASQKFIEDSEREARKLLHTRQGELLSLVSSAEKLLVDSKTLDDTIAALKEKKEVPSMEESVSMVSEKSDNVAVVEQQKNKRKSSRKRPDQVGTVAETVKRLKEARSKKKD